MYAQTLLSYTVIVAAVTFFHHSNLNYFIVTTMYILVSV